MSQGYKIFKILKYLFCSTVPEGTSDKLWGNLILSLVAKKQNEGKILIWRQLDIHKFSTPDCCIIAIEDLKSLAP